MDRIAFACLRDDSIKAMIPKVGPQTEFLAQWNAEFGNSPSVDSVRSVRDRIFNYYLFVIQNNPMWTILNYKCNEPRIIMTLTGSMRK